MAEPPPAIDYVERWRRTVAARREQHDAVCAADGRTTDDYWARRAEGYRKFVQQSWEGRDPFIESILRHLRPEDTVLDVGAGTGRHAIPLARDAERVLAVEPSAAMLRFLREDADAEGLGNVDVIEGAWPDIAGDVPEADIVISAHVLYPIEDVVPFLEALDAHARRFCFLNLMAQQPWFDRIGLWEAVHGEDRLPQPTYIDAVNVLHQLGCYANVEVEWVETPRLFENLEDAIDRFAESVAVGENEEKRVALEAALRERLEREPDGRYAFPIRTYPIATVWWEAGALTRQRAT
jgi:SAM-dependent methyltransferase